MINYYSINCQCLHINIDRIFLFFFYKIARINYFTDFKLITRGNKFDKFRFQQQ